MIRRGRRANQYPISPSVRIDACVCRWGDRVEIHAFHQAIERSIMYRLGFETKPLLEKDNTAHNFMLHKNNIKVHVQP
jgi:hypothetical protein